MQSRSVSYRGASGQSMGHLAIPASGHGPGVLVIHEWWGLDDTVRATADRLASEGFVAFAPDLFDGVTTRDFGEADELMRRLAGKSTMDELSAGLDLLERRVEVTRRQIGVLGSGMGGGLMLELAAADPGRIAAGVFYYPLGDFNHMDLTRVASPILGHVGSEDELVGTDQVRQLTSALNRSHAPSVLVESYDGVGHAFLDERNKFGTYNEELASATWGATVTFLASHLGGQPLAAVIRLSAR